MEEANGGADEIAIEYRGAGSIPPWPGEYANCRVIFDARTHAARRIEPLTPLADEIRIITADQVETPADAPPGATEPAAEPPPATTATATATATENENATANETEEGGQ